MFHFVFKTQWFIQFYMMFSYKTIKKRTKQKSFTITMICWQCLQPLDRRPGRDLGDAYVWELPARLHRPGERSLKVRGTGGQPESFLCCAGMHTNNPVRQQHLDSPMRFDGRQHATTSRDVSERLLARTARAGLDLLDGGAPKCD